QRRAPTMSVTANGIEGERTFPAKRMRFELEEVRSELFAYTYGLDARRRVGDLASSIMALFRMRPDLFGSRLEVVRFALGYRGRLRELFAPHLELTDDDARQLLTSLEKLLVAAIS